MRPYLNVATICERYILEADSTLTIFRVIERFTIRGASEEMPATTLRFTLVVNFRPDQCRGPMTLGVKILDPDIQSVQELKVPVHFEGPEERATGTISEFALSVSKHGLYWIVISLEEEEHTRIPLRVVYQKQPTILVGGQNS